MTFDDVKDNLRKRLAKVLGFDEKHKMKGRLVLDLYGPDGELKEHRDTGWNTLCELYDTTVADRMVAGADALVDNTGIGNVSGGKTAASIALEGQLARVVDDSDVQGAGAADNDTIHTATFAAGIGTGALVEAGLFTDPAGNTLMAYQEFAVVNKGAEDTLVTTWTIQHGAS